MRMQDEITQDWNNPNTPALEREQDAQIREQRYADAIDAAERWMRIYRDLYPEDAALEHVALLLDRMQGAVDDGDADTHTLLAFLASDGSGDTLSAIAAALRRLEKSQK